MPDIPLPTAILAVCGALGVAGLLYWIGSVVQSIHDEVASLDHRSGLPLICIMLPLARRFGGFTRILDFLPIAEYERWAERALNLTGLDSLFKPKEYIGSHIVLLIAGSCLPLLLLVTVPDVSRMLVVFSSLGLGAVLALMPFIMLAEREKRRNWEIFLTLPYFIDLLTLLVEAGMEFTRATERVASLMQKGPLKTEMERFARQLRLGAGTINALDEIRQRIDLEEVHTFVLAMKRTTEMGSPLGETLKTQSAIMRESRLRKAEARANQVPVKILIPLILFIFPSIFILLVGPMVIRSMAAH